MEDLDLELTIARIKILAALHRAIDWNAPYHFLDEMTPLRYKGKPFSKAFPEMIEDPEEREAYEKSCVISRKITAKECTGNISAGVLSDTWESSACR